MTRYLLDTNICIALLKRRAPQAESRLLSIAPDDVAVSVITAAELYLGVQKCREPDRERRIVEDFLGEMDVLPLDVPAAQSYARLRADLERRGQRIGELDMLIAAHALSQRLTVVTNNVREFGRIDELAVEDWTAP